jgi:hypothetical protein
MTSEEITEAQDVPFHFVQDTLNRRKYQLHIDWTPKAKYEFTIPAGVFENLARESNDTLKYNYTAADPEKFAILNIDIRSKRSDVQYILQVTNARGQMLREIRNVEAGKYVVDYISPGEVMLRVVEDMNGNGKWDTGDMVLMRQPERTEIFKNEDGTEIITTKENWEFDIEVDMDQLFAPMTMEALVKMLDDREDERLKKLAIDEAKKRQEAAKSRNNNQNSGMGLGGMGGGLGGGLGGLGGGGGAGGLRSNTNTGSMAGGMGNLRR